MKTYLIALLACIGLGACAAVYVSENRQRGTNAENPACVFACASNVPQPASAPEQ